MQEFTIFLNETVPDEFMAWLLRMVGDYPYYFKDDTGGERTYTFDRPMIDGRGRAFIRTIIYEREAGQQLHLPPWEMARSYIIATKVGRRLQVNLVLSMEEQWFSKHWSVVLLEPLGQAWPEARSALEKWISTANGLADGKGQETAGSTADDEIDEATYPPEIYNIELMKGFYSGYNVETAKIIIDGLTAYESCVGNGENWTVTYLANGVNVVRETASRYISAFKKAELTKIRGVPLP